MTDRALTLLKEMIAIPSTSRSESAVADLIFSRLQTRGIEPHRHINNIWAVSENFDPHRPVLMLNSHIDTVRPADGWTFEPFSPATIGDRLYGLGSNDAGASVVSLISTFEALRMHNLPFNLLLAITAEEEVGGEGGIRALLPHLAEKGIIPDMAIVGEPTEMHPAIAERGLVVLDCVAKGVAGHAARGGGVNAIYKAMADINTLRSLRFPLESETLGPVGIAVTMIQAGTQHNVIPAECRFVVDVRTTDAYTNEQTVEMIQRSIASEAVPRSTRIRASVIDRRHPLVQAAVRCGGTPFVSPTTSDMSLMHHIPSLKIGPGDSARSHRADEYIKESEIAGALHHYNNLILSLADIIENGNQTMEQGH